LALLPSLALDQPPARALEAALRVPARAQRPRALIFEGVVLPPALRPAFRSESAARRRLYRTEGFELDLAQNEDGSLLGELVRAGGSDARTPEGDCTLYGSELVEHAHLDSEGYFRFAAVRPGRHVLVIESDAELLLLPELEIAPG